MANVIIVNIIRIASFKRTISSHSISKLSLGSNPMINSSNVSAKCVIS
jgi:hypothetical protein